MMIITINTEGAAFREEYATYEYNKEIRNQELERIFIQILQDLDNGYKTRPILDINGNKIGSWSLEED